MQVSPLGAGDVDVLQELIESQAAYTERVTGHPPGPSDALSTLLMRPEGLPEERKRVYGAWHDEALVGAIDVLFGYPRDEFAYVGLLLVRSDVSGRGFGRRAHDRAVDAIRCSYPAATTLRLAIVDTNAAHAEPFWRALGYEPTGESRPYTYDKLVSTVRLWERPV